MRVKGEGTQGGETVGVDMSFKGQDAWGSINSGGVLQIESVGGSTYIKAADAFWKNILGSEAAPALAVIKGRWLKVGANDAMFGTLASFAKKGDFLSQLLAAGGTVKKGKASTIDGVRTIAIVDTGKDGGTLYLDSATARPVRIVPPKSSKTTGVLNFTYVDPGQAPKAPASKDVLDASALSGGASPSASS
jgi:hypothetical protein